MTSLCVLWKLSGQCIEGSFIGSYWQKPGQKDRRNIWAQQTYFGAGGDKSGLPDVFERGKGCSCFTDPWFHICIRSSLSIHDAAQVWECVNLFQEGSAQHPRFFVDCIDLPYLRLRREGWGLCVCCQVRESRAGSSSKLQVVQLCPESPLNAILLFLCGLAPWLLVWKHAKTEALRRFLASGFLGCCRITFKNLASCNQEAEPIQFFFFSCTAFNLSSVLWFCIWCAKLYAEDLKCEQLKTKQRLLAYQRQPSCCISISFIGSYWLHFLPPLWRVHTTVFIIT